MLLPLKKERSLEQPTNPWWFSRLCLQYDIIKHKVIVKTEAWGKIIILKNSGLKEVIECIIRVSIKQNLQLFPESIYNNIQGEKNP